MNIRKLEIQNLRSLTQTQIEFNNQTNIMYGKNGSGKTSILEAIHVLCYTKSFKPHTQNSVITKNKKTMHLRGLFEDKHKNKLKIEYNQHKNEKNIKINNNKINKMSKIIGLAPCVVLSPEDIDIISGPNNNRIKYIDKILSTTNKKYLKHLIDFKKILKQRNKLLKTHPTPIEISIWDDKLIESATQLWHYRDVFFKEYSSKVQAQHKKIKIKGKVEILYKKQTNTNKSLLKKKIKEFYNKDILTQKTNLGPHKDRIQLFLDEKNMRHEASQGEKKLFLIAIKKVEASYFYQKLNIKPIILLDDLFAKLDSQKCVDVLKLFNNTFQTIITTTDNTINSNIKQAKANIIYLEKKQNICFAA